MTEEERAAQLVVDKSILLFHKSRLMKQIDESLLNRDKNLFDQLTVQYNQLMKQYAHVLN